MQASFITEKVNTDREWTAKPSYNAIQQASKRFIT